MEFLPQLKIGWLNGWLLLFILYAGFGVLLLVFPRAVVKRLYERNGRTRAYYVRRALGVPIVLGAIGLFVLLPLKLGAWPFWVGLGIYLLGLGVFNAALINYRNTPLDRPVTEGVYRYSRNPQLMGMLVVFMGTAVAVGSWLMVALAALMGFGVHTRILAEERACLAQYGDAYRAYMARVPRYFGLPREPSPTDPPARQQPAR